MTTVNIGVLEGTRLTDWRILASTEQTFSANVTSFSYDELIKQMTEGNLDVIVGLPEIDSVKDLFPENSVVVATRTFDYFVNKQDQRQLHDYVFETSFLKQVNRVGYVNLGEPGVINELMLPQAQQHQAYVACDSLSQCNNYLNNQEIDAFYSDLALMKELQETAELSAAGFEKHVNFSLLMNPKTLTSEEQKALTKLFSINYETQTF